MTKKIFTILAFILWILNGLNASKLVVSTDIGFDPIDNTSFLQFAFDETTEDTIVVDNVGMDWNTGPLSILRNDVTIIFEEGVVLRALPNEFDIFESLIRIQDRENISILGYEATFVMNKQEYIDAADSEFRHGISLNSATNILIEGLTIIRTGGDGIIITRSFLPTSPKNFCENITILNCKMSDNYRQGLSITSVKNANIINCEFSETNGTLPEDGIDIEPDSPEERIENVLIKGCRIFNNFGNAIQLALFMMNDNSLDVSVTVEDTYMSNNHDPSNVFAFAEIAATDNGSNGVDGFVHFKNCYIESSDWTAVYTSKTVESYDLNFSNCVFKNISNNPIAFNNPIFLEVTDYENPVPRFGGLNFTDCAIIYDENIPFLNLVENSATSDGLGDVTGNFFIINPIDPGFNMGTNPENVNITYEYFDTFPATEINLTTNQINYLEEEEFIQFEIIRTGNENLPVPVSFNYNGIAEYGVDYNRANGFTILPSLLDNSCIQLGNDNALQVSINDVLTSVTPNPDLDDQQVNIFPNPTNGLVYIESEWSNFELTIFNSNGQQLKYFKNQNNNFWIDVNQFSPGIYFLEIRNNETNKYNYQKLIKQ